MLKRLIILSLIACLGSMCTQNNSQSSTGNDPIIIPIEGVDFDIIPSEKFLEAADFVFLETSEASAIGEMSTYHMANDEIFVYSPLSSKLVKRFAADGRFLNDYGAIGKGPGEYTYTSDVLVGDDFVEIMDGSNIVSINRYSLDGKFLEKKTGEIPQYSSSFTLHPKTGEYFFYTLYNNYKVIKLSNECTNPDSLLPCSGTNRLNIYVDALISCPSEEIMLYETGYNRIWFWNGEQFDHKYSFDFGRYTLEPGENDEERFFSAMREKGMWSIRWIVGNKKYLFFTAMFQNPGSETINDIQLLHLIYHRKSGKTLRISNGDILEQFQSIFALDDNNILYLTGIPVHLDEWDPWKSHIKEIGLPFNIEDNPIIFKVDLDKLF